LEGKRMIIVLTPKKGAGSSKAAKKPAAPAENTASDASDSEE